MVRKDKTLSIKIPAGVDTGDRIRLAGEGDIGRPGSQPGDLYVQIKLTKHSIFERDGDDLYCEIPVGFVTLALGGEIQIPTLEGRANLKIPSESQSEKVFRLRGKGVRNVRNGAQGNLHCKVVVETPVNLNDEQKQLLRKFEESLNKGGDSHNPKSRSWSDRIKSFFDEIVS